MPYVSDSLKTEAFIAGKIDLYTELQSNPQLRMVPISRLNRIRNDLYSLGRRFRVRYRGPKKGYGDTHKRFATAFTVYLVDQ